MNQIKTILIAAVDAKGGISKNGIIPWKIPQDMTFFRATTTITLDKTKRNVVIYGRKTLEFMKQTLPNRINIVVSGSTNTNTNDVVWANSVGAAISKGLALNNVENIFICGGSRIYNEVIKDNVIDEYYITNIKNYYHCDNFIDMDVLGERLLRLNRRQLYTDETIDIVHWS
jgi:dihydrofolate reductase